MKDDDLKRVENAIVGEVVFDTTPAVTIFDSNYKPGPGKSSGAAFEFPPNNIKYLEEFKRIQASPVKLLLTVYYRGSPAAGTLERFMVKNPFGKKDKLKSRIVAGLDKRKPISRK